jgi:hypothetical protein
MKYFFLTGAHKSGTSWLNRMVGEHPAVAIPRSEMLMFGHPRSLVGPKLDKLVSDWLDLPTLRVLFDSDDHAEIKANLRRVMVKSVLDRFAGSESEALGDKTPLFTLRGLPELKESFPGAYVISILRDGRDTVVSHHFHNLRLRDFKLYPDRAAGEAAYAYHIAKTSDEWVPLLNEATMRRVATDWGECIRAESSVKKIFGRKGLCLRYEQVLSDPRQWLSTVFEHLELPFDDKLLDKIIGATEFETLSKGRKPGESDPASFVRKGVVGDWKLYFDQDSAAIFNECAGEELIVGGYADSLYWLEQENSTITP